MNQAYIILIDWYTDILGFFFPNFQEKHSTRISIEDFFFVDTIY